MPWEVLNPVGVLCEFRCHNRRLLLVVRRNFIVDTLIVLAHALEYVKGFQSAVHRFGDA